jgi:hypothetical protein
MNVPTGIFFIGSALPALMSDFSPDTTVSPTLSPTGAIIYLFSPSA